MAGEVWKVITERDIGEGWTEETSSMVVTTGTVIKVTLKSKEYGIRVTPRVSLCFVPGTLPV